MRSLLCLVVIFYCDVTESVYIQSSNSNPYSEAVFKCNNLKMEMLSMSTMEERSAAMTYFDTAAKDESWLGLTKNATTGSYYWANGKVLTELQWGTNEPAVLGGETCVMYDASGDDWHTTLCSSLFQYVCVDADGSYTKGTGIVDFYTAFSRCQDENKLLPLSITKVEQTKLKQFTNIDVWLGLIKYGDYFKWVDGVDLSPPHEWADSERGDTVHYHHTGSDKGFHSTSTTNQDYICQTKTVAGKVTEGYNRFSLISQTAFVMGEMRLDVIVSSKTDCAVYCSRDTGCSKFTKTGSICRTYGAESFYLEKDNAMGTNLWEGRGI